MFFLQMGRPCNPKCGCFRNKFTHEERQSIFSGYYSLQNEQLKNQYLIGQMSKRPIKRKRSKNPNAEPKIQWSYKLMDRDVCRHTFMSLHGISVSKLTEASKIKRQSPQGIAHPDMRGKSKFGINIFIDDNVKYLFNRPSC